jgi:uncharacterized spore protein YtfJ
VLRSEIQQGVSAMNVQELMAKVQDAASVKRVFGEPYERDGVIVIPVAKIGAGGGGGGGEGDEGKGWGGGGGFGGQPVGAFVIRDGNVHWRPAVDVTAIVLRAQTVVISALLTLRAIEKARARGGPGRRGR